MLQIGDIGDWVVQRTRRDLRRVRIRLGPGMEITPQLVKLRTLVPKLAKLPPRELLEQSKRSEGFDMGVIEGREAWKLSEVLRPEGFELDIEDASYIDYFARKRRPEPMGVIIKDEEENEAFCRELIARGCAIEECEA